jgi:lipoic acid synthetase
VSVLANSRLDSQAVSHVDLGRSGYGAVLELQRNLHRRRVAGEAPDLLLTVEHEPVLTVGRRGSPDNVLVSRESLDAEGIRIFEVERGGDVTYHGPGQLVVYPIVDLRDHGRDVRGFVERLERAIVATLKAYEIEGRAVEGRPGVWVGDRKIASIGLAIRKWVTMHGLALNVDVELRHFAMIRPCGMDIDVVSMASLTGRSTNIGVVRETLLKKMEEVFGWRIETADLAAIAGGHDV